MTSINREHLVQEYKRIQAEISDRQARLEEIKNDFLALYRTGQIDPKTTIADTPVVFPKPTSRLNPKKIEAAFPVTTHPEYYTPKVDTKKVRHHIAEADLAQYMTTGDQTVRIG